MKRTTVKYSTLMCEQTFCDCYFDQLSLKLVGQFYAKHIHLINTFSLHTTFLSNLMFYFLTIQTVIRFYQKWCNKWLSCVKLPLVGDHWKIIRCRQTCCLCVVGLMVSWQKEEALASKKDVMLEILDRFPFLNSNDEKKIQDQSLTGFSKNTHILMCLV